MTMLKHIIMWVGIGLLLACGPRSYGNWTLDSGRSHVNFSTTKNKTIDETHTFNTISGALEADGIVRLKVDLDSVNTNIAKRDERMRIYLFETDKYPHMQITTHINEKAYNGLSIGEEREEPIKVTVDLHGVKLDQNVLVKIKRISETEFSVKSAVPIVVTAKDFNLESGVEKLRSLANLQSIKPEVDVEFALVFTRS